MTTTPNLPLLQPLSPQVTATIQGGSWAYHGRNRCTAQGRRYSPPTPAAATASFQSAANSLDNLLLS